MSSYQNAEEMLFTIRDRLALLLLNKPCEPLDEGQYPAKYTDIAHAFNALLSDLSEIHATTTLLAEGISSGSTPSRRNYLAAPIKRLQSQIAILEWNSSQLASGKIASKIHTRGELFQSFNRIVDLVASLSLGSGASSPETEYTDGSSWRFHQILLALNKIHAIVIETNAAGDVVYANQPAQAFLGKCNTIHEVSPDSENTAVLNFLSQSTTDDIDSFPRFSQIHEPSTDRWYKISVDKLSLIEGQDFFVHMIDDITDWKRHEEELSISASTDPLTHVFNLRAGLNAISKLLETIDPKDENCIVFIDLDGLKQVNDNHGHKAGDFFIKTVATSIVSTIRRSDVVARYGGDEFFIFFGKCSHESGEKRIMHIKKKLQHTKEQLALPYDPEFSYGIHSFNGADNLEVAEVIHRADKLMYERKRSKRKAQPQ